VTPAVPPLLVIAGATATGKTRLSIRLAEALTAGGIPAEIISADSRQVYRGLDIGTAKADAEERAGIPHHGLDLVEPNQPFSVADYLDHVRPVLAAIAARGGLAILVGGTGFYLRAVAGGLDTDALPSDPGIRRAVEAEIATGGLEAAARHLQLLAPGLAARIDTRNPRRLARALEIATIAGDVQLPPPRPYAGRLAWLGLRPDPDAHRLAIQERARAQFDAGLVEEAAALRERFDPDLPAFSAIGYREAWAYLDGQMDREAAIALDAQRNVDFARRQATWFRSERVIEWLEPGGDPLALARRRAESLVGDGRSAQAGIVRR
jgi:tRNA dimethylallyltransferase